MSESSKSIEEFRDYRKRMNARILDPGGVDHKGIKRFFNLDTAAYRDGALDGRTKELLGLVASAVLRCNDCIDYHLDQCVEVGWSDDELYDALNVALVVGGSIVIPHLRHAVDTIDQLRAEGKSESPEAQGQKAPDDRDELYEDDRE
ncbi:MAG TPA: carboxymuconolactone decarboxylase family protein [Thermoanaerobaculia bacterium]|nr:carboxymuconolactone decarboxylase family protein [Thermoanaerobaculia bacterium]